MRDFRFQLANRHDGLRALHAQGSNIDGLFSECIGIVHAAWVVEEGVPARRGFVYAFLAEAVARIKFGFSTDVAGRLLALQTAAPCRLRLLGSVPASANVERWIHRYLRPFRANGEWYSLSPEVITVVSALVLGNPAQRDAA